MPRHDPNGGLDHESPEDQARDDAEIRKRKSGANIPESQRHTQAVKLRLRPEIVAQLDALCTQNPKAPWTRSDFVAALIDSETNRKARRKK